jgi:ribosomal protein S18 acetylase RimI-like enzyme
MDSPVRIRAATHADLETLVGFTLREAREAEGVELSGEDVRRGVAAGLANPEVARYWVADSAEGEVIAATSVVTEWSNFHGGRYWWVQSLYIVPEHRGRGLVELLLDHLAAAAGTAGALDLRLVVQQSNHRAIRAYRRCGFTAAASTIMRRNLEAD